MSKDGSRAIDAVLNGLVVRIWDLASGAQRGTIDLASSVDDDGVIRALAFGDGADRVFIETSRDRVLGYSLGLD